MVRELSPVANDRAGLRILTFVNASSSGCSDRFCCDHSDGLRGWRSYPATCDKKSEPDCKRVELSRRAGEVVIARHYQQA
jgi:hypothetical protein